MSGCDGGTVGVSWAGNRACEFAGGEDNVACTEGACFYKSHFILKGHVGEVKDVFCFVVACRQHIKYYFLLY